MTEIYDCARVCVCMYVCENDSIANAMKTRCNILIYEKISSNPKTGLKRLVYTVKLYIYIYCKIVCVSRSI